MKTEDLKKKGFWDFCSGWLRLKKMMKLFIFEFSTALNFTSHVITLLVNFHIYLAIYLRNAGKAKRCVTQEPPTKMDACRIRNKWWQ